MDPTATSQYEASSPGDSIPIPKPGSGMRSYRTEGPLVIGLLLSVPIPQPQAATL